MAQLPTRTVPSDRRRVGLVMACGLAVAAMLGCREDEEIRAYKVPKVEAPHPVTKAAPTLVDMTGPGDGKAPGPVRLLGGIFPRPERTWFFKLVGPKPNVDKHEVEFRQFLRSVRFTGKANPPMTWTAPEGWKHEPGGGLRYATFRVGAESPIELTVIGLGGEAGSLLANVNRWRNQIGLKPITEAELGRVAHELPTEDAGH